jgi:hypothetical protein
MSDELDLTYPTCGEPMEVLTVEEGSTPSNLLRVCPFCATWLGTMRMGLSRRVSRKQWKERNETSCYHSEKIAKMTARIAGQRTLFLRET